VSTRRWPAARAGRRRHPGPGEPDGDRAQRARPGRPRTLRPGRPRPGEVRRRAGRRRLDRL